MVFDLQSLKMAPCRRPSRYRAVTTDATANDPTTVGGCVIRPAHALSLIGVCPVLAIQPSTAACPVRWQLPGGRQVHHTDVTEATPESTFLP